LFYQTTSASKAAMMNRIVEQVCLERIVDAELCERRWGGKNSCEQRNPKDARLTSYTNRLYF